MRGVLAMAAAAGLALVPVQVEVPGNGDAGFITLDGVCGQATSCTTADDYICSTHNRDHMDWICYTGCSTELE